MQGPAPAPPAPPKHQGGKSISTSFLVETASGDSLIVPDPTTTPTSPAAPTPVPIPAVVSPAAPISLVSAVTAPWQNAVWMSGGNGDPPLAGEGTQTEESQGVNAAADGSAVPTANADHGTSWEALFTEAVRHLQATFTATPNLLPAPPMNPNGPPAPMNEPSAPMPSGKGTGATLLEKVELYAVPAALALVSVGSEFQERHRRKHRPERPR